VRDRSPSGRIQGSEGQKILLRQYARRVDDALRTFLARRETPLLLAAVEPLNSIFRSVNSYPHLVATGVLGVTEQSSDGVLAQAARQVLDELYARELADLRAIFDWRAGQGRATTDITVQTTALLSACPDPSCGWVRANSSSGERTMRKRACRAK
jgi:hypothetical protein